MQPWIVPATRFRYSFPVFAELERGQGAKFVSLVHRLQASDRAIRQALDWLLELGWIERNPGYGHPSRPEYLVAKLGTPFAEKARKLDDELREWTEENLGRERWSLAVIGSLASHEMRFGELQKLLPRITPRALAGCLKGLQAAGVIDRRVEQGQPPPVVYRLTPWGLKLFSLFGD